MANEKVVDKKVKEEPKKVETEKKVEEVKPEEAPKKRGLFSRNKKEAKPEAPKKVMPTSARATSTNVRVTARKARLVIDLVRGKNVSEALGILKNVNKAASVPVMKTIMSAASNATNNFGMDESSLYISEIYANDGLKMRRYLPRAKGSASGLVKRNCHITVVVKMR